MLECSSAIAIAAALKGPEVPALPTLMGGTLHYYPSRHVRIILDSWENSNK